MILAECKPSEPGEQTLMGSRIFVLPVLQELEEFLRATLFEKTHQGALHCLHFGAGDLGDLAITVDKASGDLLKLEVASDISMHEDLRKFSGCDDELRNEVDGVISITTEISRGRLIPAEFTVELSSKTWSETVRVYGVGRRPG